MLLLLIIGFFLLNLKFDHEYWMRYALQLATCALNEGEVPVGAVLVYKNQMISQGWNKQISYCDPTAHAEILALRNGGTMLKNYRLVECTLYVTLSPCIMCFGAMIHGRINMLVYGAQNKKVGGINSLMDLFKTQKINHKFQVIQGVLEKPCLEILNNFFYIRRFIKSKNT